MRMAVLSGLETHSQRQSKSTEVERGFNMNNMPIASERTEVD